MKTLKNRPQKLLIIDPNLFFTVQPSQQPTTHSPELIFHFIDMSQDTSVSLSVQKNSNFANNDSPLFIKRSEHD